MYYEKRMTNHDQYGADMFEIEFHWVRHPQKKFELQKLMGRQMIALPSRAELKRLEVYSPLQAGAFKSHLTAPAGAMLLEFAKVLTVQDALAFVNEYGPLTGNGRTLAGESAADIVDEAEKIRETIEGIVELDTERMETAILETDYGSLNVELRSIGGTKKLSLRVPNLLGALKLMLAQKLSSGAVYRRCPFEECGDIFDVGPGTGRTMKNFYCTPLHQIRHNSINRNKGKQP